MSDKDCTYTLQYRIRERIAAAKFDGMAIPRPRISSGPEPTAPPDDLYLLDAATVMPVIEKLIAVAIAADKLLNCAAEFATDVVSCSECFQAGDDAVDHLKSEVGYG